MNTKANKAHYLTFLVICTCPLHIQYDLCEHIYFLRASKAKVLRLEKEAQEMEKSMEALRHAQAKCAELEKTNKKLYSQTHSDRKEIIKLREVS